MTSNVKYTTTTTTLSSAIEGAFSDLEELASEMRDWADSMEERFSSTDKYQTVSSTADELEGLQVPDVPSDVDERDTTYSTGSKRKMPRWLRRDNAVAALNGAVSSLEEWLDQNDEDAEQYSDVETLKDELEEAISTAEGVEFPGMMG